ncbi:RelA/SpoT domain-containing protein [Pontibacter sp. MBLB2868]|uniref:RelA/SpoT domain-containing protein n=1 Tax=Pontibacter sp. MBLB2868 TaxID=3451555 RepID=UPI003F74B9A3
MSENNPTQKATVPFILSLLDESEEELRALGIDPQHLLDIYNDYLTRQTELTDIAGFISRLMQKAKGVHSIKYRVKEPQHLLKKIVRKKKEYPQRTITSSNYMDLINDLVGVRVLHLHKEAWEEIGLYILDKWKLKREPYAYVKSVQKSTATNKLTSFGCKMLVHPSGYKAIHFVIETKPEKQRYFAEIQLRTLFEEGWSEIDHSIRYPDHDNSELLDCMLQLLNKLTTQADEMASYMRMLTNKLNEYKQQTGNRNIAAELHAFVDELPLQNEDKKQLYSCIGRLTEKK